MRGWARALDLLAVVLLLALVWVFTWSSAPGIRSGVIQSGPYAGVRQQGPRAGASTVARVAAGAASGVATAQQAGH